MPFNWTSGRISAAEVSLASTCRTYLLPWLVASYLQSRELAGGFQDARNGDYKGYLRLHSVDPERPLSSVPNGRLPSPGRQSVPKSRIPPRYASPATLEHPQ